MRRSGNSNTKFLFAISMVAMLVHGCSTQPPMAPANIEKGDYEYVKRYLTWMAAELMDRHDTPGVSIALIDDQKTIWSKGFGYSDYKAKIPTNDQTVYRVGSIAKLFTATAAMNLVEQGKLDIDSPINRVLPEFSVKTHFTNAPAVTARSIMTHHSGLPADILKGLWTHDKSSSYTDVVRLMNDNYAAYPPGYIYSYSNAAYSLLGHVVEKASGRDFSSYVNDTLVQPMGMTHTGFQLTDAMRPLLSKGHSDYEAIDVGSLRDIPAGGLYSNVDDLSKFVKMVLANGRYNNKQIIQPRTLDKMLAVQNADVKLDFGLSLGLGWFLVDHGIKGVNKVASHGGGSPCYFSQMIVLPEVKLGAVVLANSCTSGPVVAEMATTALKLAMEVKTGFKQPLKTDLVKAPVDENPSNKLLQKFNGQYATWLGLIKVKPNGNKLQAKLSGWNFDLIPHTDGRFSLQFKLFGLISIRHLYGIDLDNVLLEPVDVDSKQVVVMTFKGRNQVLGEKVHPTPIPKAWLARLGYLQVYNQDQFMQFRDNQLKIEDGILVMAYKLKMPVLPEQSAAVPIRPVSDNQAIVLGLGRGMNETVEIVRVNNQEVLRFSGYDARWVKYDSGRSIPAWPAQLARDGQSVSTAN